MNITLYKVNLISVSDKNVLYAWQVVDFTVPFWEESLGVAVKHVDRTASNLAGVFRPFSLWVLALLIASTGVMSFSFWIFEYVTVSQDKDNTLARSFMASLFFVIGSILGQGELLLIWCIPCLFPCDANI